MDKLKIPYPIIVEGKYDKQKLSLICEGLIIKTDGFGVFKASEKAALIRTLALDPQILLLDEPFSALDYQTRLSVCDDVYKIIREEQKTALLITHDISEAISVADRILVLSKRPATIVAEHDITFPESEPLRRRENKEFSKWFELLWKELNV